MSREHPLRLTEWRMRNFKSVESADIALTGLTALVGTNSAGKSSLIQSILLFLQAQNSPMERPDYMPLNGGRLQLGAFQEVRFERARGKATIGLGGTLSTGREATSFGWFTRFGPPDDGDEGRMRVVEATVDVDIRAEATFQGRLTLKHRMRPASFPGPMPVLLWRDERKARLRSLRRLDPGQFTGTMEINAPAKVRRRISAGVPDRGLPGVFLERRRFSDAILDPYLHGGSAIAAVDQDEADLKIRAAVREILREGTGLRHWESVAEQVVDDLSEAIAAYLSAAGGGSAGPDVSDDAVRFLADAREIVEPILNEAQVTAESRAAVEQAIRRALRGGGRRSSVDIPVLADMPDAERFTYVQTYVRNTLADGVAYLGPLRSTPRVSPGRTPPEGVGVGAEGEFTAAVLRARRNEIVQHCRLGSSEIIQEPLGDAVTYWMAAMGLVDEVSSRDLDRYGIEVLVRPAGVRGALNLRNVGVGINQVLPVLVLCLLADEGSLILLEQPELHLHPLGQQSLADFFIAMMRSGRQVLIETHSDHVVSRLRRRVAEDATDALVDDIGFVFAERHDGRTTYRSVKPNAFGGIDQWPAGFMDQGARESAVIIEAALRKRDRGGPRPN